MQISQKTNTDFVMGYALNLCKIHISVVPYNQKIRKREIDMALNRVRIADVADALEFMRFLQGKGIQIPRDIQIIGFDDNLASRESNPALTTIHQEAPLRAKTAIKCLEAMRDGAECETEIVLPVELIKRESTRKL